MKLTPAERIELVEQIWESVAASPAGNVDLSAEQLAELESRWQEFLRNPAAGSTWEEVKARLTSRK